MQLYEDGQIYLAAVEAEEWTEAGGQGARKKNPSCRELYKDRKARSSDHNEWAPEKAIASR